MITDVIVINRLGLAHFSRSTCFSTTATSCKAFIRLTLSSLLETLHAPPSTHIPERGSYAGKNEQRLRWKLAPFVRAAPEQSSTSLHIRQHILTPLPWREEQQQKVRENSKKETLQNTEKTGETSTLHLNIIRSFYALKPLISSPSSHKPSSRIVKPLPAASRQELTSFLFNISLLFSTPSPNKCSAYCIHCPYCPFCQLKIFH